MMRHNFENQNQNQKQQQQFQNQNQNQNVKKNYKSSSPNQGNRLPFINYRNNNYAYLWKYCSFNDVSNNMNYQIIDTAMIYAFL